MFTLRQYLDTLSEPEGLTRTLGAFEVCRDAQGRMRYSAGNSAVVFRIRLAGRLRSLRCYRRPMRHLRAIYGGRLLERELYLYTAPDRGEWVDVVLGDWIEGTTLREAVAEAARTRDRQRLGLLAGAFDRLAAELVADDRAHGDLKPENIVVDPAGALHPIDLDAAFLPAFAGERSPELGTAAYQHPARTAEDFDASLDDFPAALISTALHALHLDPTLHDRYGQRDGLLFDPPRIASDDALREVLERFERTGNALRYRIARLLLHPLLRLPGLAELLAMRTPDESAGTDTPADTPADTDIPADTDTPAAAVPELFEQGGRWGYRTPHGTVVPPLYDCGFEFREGLAPVLLGRTWHYIDMSGRTRISCPGCEAVKPFRNGRAVVVRDGRRSEIDRSGARCARAAEHP